MIVLRGSIKRKHVLQIVRAGGEVFGVFAAQRIRRKPDKYELNCAGRDVFKNIFRRQKTLVQILIGTA